MFSYVMSGGLRGIGCFPVRVETDISSGMPMFELVGYLGSEVREASSRVRTALKNSGYEMPVARITVNLSPADVRKSGTGFDLPIALSILECMRVIPGGKLSETFVAGELLLSGQVGYTRGILPMVLEAKRSGYKRCIIPRANYSEGSLVGGIEIIGVETLLDTVEALEGKVAGDKQGEKLSSKQGERLNKKQSEKLGEKCSEETQHFFEAKDHITEENSEEEYECDYAYDFSFVRGQHIAKRGVEIAASGLHNILMAGPPGAGKTMIARCIPSILPPLSEDEALDVAAIYSVRGELKGREDNIRRRPFVVAHHTSTDISLIGGGATVKPGSVSMAHNGVLFLDELPEFSRKSLEALREPLEDGQVNITRNKEVCSFPSNFMLVAAMNPCPCGYYPDLRRCTCSTVAREKYLSKISGPLLDRIDICINVEKLTPKMIAEGTTEESSETIRRRVCNARRIQSERFAGTNISFNSQMNNRAIEKYCRLDKQESDFLMGLAEKYEMSARAYYRVLKIARTIADLAGREEIAMEDIAEAIRLKCSFK